MQSLSSARSGVTEGQAMTAEAYVGRVTATASQCVLFFAFSVQALTCLAVSMLGLLAHHLQRIRGSH